MTTSLYDEILTVFLDQHRRELTDVELINALKRNGTSYQPNTIRHHVQLLSPGLFHVIENTDKILTIRIEPRIQICGEFSAGYCKAPQKTCNKLHLCRRVGRCTKPDCTFPHDFNKKYNRDIVTSHGCQNITPTLLIRFLLKNSDISKHTNRPNRHFRRPTYPRPLSSTMSLPVLPIYVDDDDRQIDVSLPSSKINNLITLSDIQLHLIHNNIKINDTTNATDNGYFRRITITLQQSIDVDRLLRTPIQNYKNVTIKFKRTKSIIDSTSFLLKLSINDEQDKIEGSHLQMYISQLVNRDSIERIFDISTESEQIVQIQCKTNINFNTIHQKNRSQSRLFGKDITVIQIYECDTLTIYRSDHQPIKENQLNSIFQPIWPDIFNYNFPNLNYAEVEFINSNAFRKFISMIDSIEKEHCVIIVPLVNSIDEYNSDTSSTISTDYETQNHRTKIRIRSDWALIVNDQTFKIEYQNFIRNKLGGDVEIHDDEITYNGPFPRHLAGARPILILANKTNDFMRTFQFKTLKNLDEDQIKIPEKHSKTDAHQLLEQKDDLVATKSSGVSELQHHLSPSTRSPPASKSIFTWKSSIPSTSSYTITGSDRMNIFSIERFEEDLRQYIETKFQVKFMCKRTKGDIRLVINGEEKYFDYVMHDIDELFSSLSTKKFKEETDGLWTRMKDAVQVINHHFNISNMICIAEHISTNIVHVYYFDQNSQFGIDEQRINNIIKDRLQLVSINLNSSSISSILINDCEDLFEQIQQQNSYRKDICFMKESTNIYLFGLPELIKSYRKKFEELKRKYDSQPYRLTLSEQQLNYLAYVAKNDMNQLEKEYQSQGCDVSLKRLRQNCEFLAPLCLHTEIKDKLQALAQIRTTSFNINDPALNEFISKGFEQIVSLVKSKCYLEKTIETFRESIPIPKARAANIDDLMEATTNAQSNDAFTMNMDHSSVTITIGDLTKQKVDAIVVCSTMNKLCEDITAAAGVRTQEEYDRLTRSDGFPDVTSGGDLCKKIIFIPWIPLSQDPAYIKTALETFINIGFMYADGSKSLAFPAIGCEQSNLDPMIIARYMLFNIRNHLKNLKSKMNIFFVLLPDQRNIYNAFVQCLHEIEGIDLSVNPKVSSKKKNNQSTMSYERKVMKITLIASNDRHLVQCKHDILQFVESCSAETCIPKQELLDWPQDAINKYYEYCLERRVLPKIDLEKLTLELAGSKDAVHDTEKYFYEITNQILNDQRIRAVSQGIIWSVELDPNFGNWKQYSYRLNGIIEDAHARGHSHINFENEQQEQCHIDFSTMKETIGSISRNIHRALVNSTLPKTWVQSSQNCIRIILSSSSDEFREVRKQFDVTMLGKYSQIVKIERIQNERWYKQYVAHREDFHRRYGNETERLLFHGCSSISADQIINTCFNRTFAGVNGVLYGYGVYFHAHAQYSHQYAMKNSDGERTMFLVRVLIGKTCIGDRNMKVVPNGYDTTTDGENIFVVYHDAGAYAEYLITYK